MNSLPSGNNAAAPTSETAVSAQAQQGQQSGQTQGAQNQGQSGGKAGGGANSGNSLKAYASKFTQPQGKNADKADIIFDTPASAPVVVSDGISKKQITWIAAAFLMICIMSGSFKKSVEKDEKVTLRNDLTEREIKMYKDLKSDIMTSAMIDSKLRRQRAERNMSAAVRKAETIRALQKMSCR